MGMKAENRLKQEVHMQKKKPVSPLQSPAERLAAVAELLALGIVRLAARNDASRERKKAGLPRALKHSSTSVKPLKGKEKRHG
jgi:hypothetical protein